MKNTTLRESLSFIGLNDLSVKVYEILLDSPASNITEISREAGIGRNKVYEIIDDLSTFGLLEYGKNQDRKIKLTSPSVISTLLKSKKYQLNHALSNFEEILPSLTTNYFETKKEPAIKLFEGVNKFVYLMNQILIESEDGSELLSFNEGQDLWDIVDFEYFRTVWIEKRITKNIFAKIILQYSTVEILKIETKKDRTKFRQMKMLNDSSIALGCYWVIGTKVIHWDTSNAKAVMIDNFTIAENMKANFELIWKTLG